MTWAIILVYVLVGILVLMGLAAVFFTGAKGPRQ